MATVIIEPTELRRLLNERRARGGDRWDEVWGGVHVFMPRGDNEHQKLGLDLAIAFKQITGAQQVFAGCNVSDQAVKWEKNYRCPDVAVFLPGNPAQDRGSHWYGGPDFAVEILSPNDLARKKLDFYAAVQVRELLLVDRKPWRLELRQRQGGDWIKLGGSTLEQPAIVSSTVLPVTFQLVPGTPRPRIDITHSHDGRHWLV